MKKDKINLALFWSRYDGGVTSVSDLVLKLDKERFNVIFIYLTGYGVEKNIIEEAGYDVFYLSDIKRFRSPRLSILFRLIRILKERKVDILHCHAHKPSFYGSIAGMFAKTPVVLSHVHGLNRTRNIRRKLLNSFVFRGVNRIVVCTKSVRDDVLVNNPSVCADKVIALENSVDFEKFSDVTISREQARKRISVPDDAFIFGTIGRLAPTKGQSYLIQAFAKVKQQLPKSRLLIVGTGRLANSLMAEAEKTGFGESINFLGHRDDIPSILKGLDVFILPSVAEAFGLALAEAMSVGIPCISTEVGGIPEVTNGGETCILVPPKDSEVLAQAMINLARTPREQIERRVKKGQDRIRRLYSHQIVREKLINLYETELHNH